MWRMREHYRTRRINDPRLCDIDSEGEQHFTTAKPRPTHGSGLFCCPKSKGHTITGTWRTNWRGNTYTLDNQGRLQKDHMNIDQLLDQRFRTDFTNLQYRDRPRMIDRIIREELDALKQRRSDHDKEHTP